MARISSLSKSDQRLLRRMWKGKEVRPKKIIRLHDEIRSDFYEQSDLSPEGLDWKKPTKKINAEVPKGRLKPMEEISDGFIDEIVNFKGTKRHVIANLGIRKAGTRVGIHVHENDGITFVLKGKGEITDFVEGSERSLNKQGDYYFMPRNVPMSASNLSGSDMTLLDLFITDISTPPITIIEPGYPGYRNPVL